MNNIQAKPWVSFGIPVYQDASAASNKIRMIRRMGFYGPIHVSINAFTGELSETSGIKDLVLDNLVTITIHRENLGLYGNFRFLAQQCRTEFFAWVPLDDCPPIELVRLLSNSDKSDLNADLFYTRHVLIETQDPTARECSNLDMSRAHQPIDLAKAYSPDPSAIFGVWRTSWLTDNFPRRDFDWLDTHLLSTAILLGRVALKDGVRGIGLQPGRTPHSVNGKFHSPIGWSVSTLRLAAKSHNTRGVFRALTGRMLASASSICRYMLVTRK